MKLKHALLLCLTAVLAVSFASDKGNDPLALYNQIDRNMTPNLLTKSEKNKGWNLLFDGKTTSGWHGFNLKSFPDCWIIEDGVLTTTKGGNEAKDITSDKKYRNFALSLDFKLAKGSNSGIIYQVSEEPKYKYPYETGPEFQIFDQSNKAGQTMGLQSCGANYGMNAPKSFPSKPTGEWNTLLLVVNGNHITQIINGVVVVEYDKNTTEWKKLRNTGKWKDYPDYGKFDEGNIDLQNHGSQIWYRNIKLKELN